MPRTLRQLGQSSNTTEELSPAQRLRQLYGTDQQISTVSPLTPAERARNELTKYTTGVDVANSDGQSLSEFFKKNLGRGGVALSSAARSAIFIPAALEKIFSSAIEASIDAEVPDWLQLVENTQQGLFALEEDIMDATGLQSAEVARIIGEIAGGVVGGFGGLGAARVPGIIATRFGAQRLGAGLFKTLTLPQFVAQASRTQNFRNSLHTVSKLAADGAFFELSRSSVADTEARDILLATALGAAGGGLISKLAVARAQRHVSYLASRTGLSPDTPAELMENVMKGIETDAPPRLLDWIGNVNSHDEILNPIKIFQQNIDQKALPAARAAMVTAGEKGTGAIRGLALAPEHIDNLRLDFPELRIETIADEFGQQTVLYGPRPELLSKGVAVVPRDPLMPPPELSRMTHSGFLTDETIEFYGRNGYLPRQRAQLNGLEVFIEGPAKGGLVNVRSKTGTAFKPMPLERLQLVDDNVAKIGNGDLADQFNKHLDVFDGTWDEAFDSFVEMLPAINRDPARKAIKPALRQFLIERSSDRINTRLKPTGVAEMRKFKQALLEAFAPGVQPENWTFMQEAAAKGHIVTNLSGGRVKLTRFWTGESTMPLNRNLARRNVLANYRHIDSIDGIDFTPDFGEVPKEIFDGIANAVHPANPSVMPDFTGAGIKDALGKPIKQEDFFGLGKIARAGQMGGLVQNAEDKALDLQRLTQEPVWTQIFRPVQQGKVAAINEAEPFMRRLQLLARDSRGIDVDAVRGWVLTEQPALFESRLADRLSKREIASVVKAGRGISKLFDDVFDVWAKSKQIDLSWRDWMRNYVPSMQEFVSETGTLNADRVWTRQGKALPKEVQFMAEFFKDGMIQGDEDIFVLAAKHIRSGFFKKNAGSAWDNAVTIANTFKDPGAKRFAADYLSAVRGIPEASQQALGKWFTEFGNSMGLSVNPVTAQRMVDNLGMLNTGALMAFRPALVARDITQNFQLLAPLLKDGNRKVFRAMNEVLDSKTAAAAREYVESIDAIIKQTPIATSEQVDTIGSVTGKALGRLIELGRDVTRAGLQWYSSADDFNRATAAITIRNSLDEVAPRIRERTISQFDLLEAAGLHVQDTIKQGQFLTILETQGFKPARDFAAREGAKHVNFLYGTENASAWTRTAFGRLFGRFGTWPAGYLNWVRHVAEANIPFDKKAQIFFKHGTLNMGMITASSAVDLNIMSWIPFAAPFYTGGPLTSVAADLFAVGNGLMGVTRGYEPGPDYSLAINRMPRHLWGFVPGSMLLQTDFRRAAERLDQDLSSLAVLEAIGVRTVDPNEAPAPPLVEQLLPRRAREQPGNFLLGPIGSQLGR